MITLFLGLLALAGGFGVATGWLQWRRAAEADKPKKRADFRRTLPIAAIVSSMFVFNLLIPLSDPPSPPLWICTSLLFLIMGFAAVQEVVRAIKAKCPGDHHTPVADSDNGMLA